MTTSSVSPGLPSITFGPGSRETIFAALRAGVRSAPAIAGLAAQEPENDPAMALLDCWAMMADVVSFYQDHLANEAYLRTAVEDRSLAELTNQIGCLIDTGVAATTALAFTLAPTTAMDTTELPIGLQVESVPVEGGLPETFETLEAIEARESWNVLRVGMPRLDVLPVPVDWVSRTLSLDGDQSQVQEGDAILILDQIIGHGRHVVVVVQSVSVSPAGDTTTIRWKTLIGNGRRLEGRELSLFHFRNRAHVFGYNAPDWRVMPDAIKKAFAANYEKETQWPGFELDGRFVDLDQIVTSQLSEGWLMLIDESASGGDTSDTSHWLAEVVSATITSQTNFAMTAQVTRLVGATSFTPKRFLRRSTAVYCNSRSVALSRVATVIVDPVRGSTITVTDLAIGMQAGRKLIFLGKAPRIVLGEATELRTDGITLVPIARGACLRLVGVPDRTSDETGGAVTTWPVVTDDGIVGTIEVSPAAIIYVAAYETDADQAEVAMVRVPPSIEQPHQLSLGSALKRWYDPASLKIYGNVAEAGHGTTVTETFGTAASPSQLVRLTHQPLTYVWARTASGRSSSLSLKVDGIVWTEVETLFGQPAGAAVYALLTDAHGDTWIQFGDGHQGRRPAAGSNNVTATYRTGIGVQGNVAEGHLTLLLDAPERVRDVTNPLPAQGGSPLPDVHRTTSFAPTRTRSLGRIVTLADYEDFARSFGGIAKAKAVLHPMPIGVGVLLTIAATGGCRLEHASTMFRYLADALAACADPSHHVQIVNYRKIEVGLTATLRINRAQDVEAVLAAVRKRLVSRYDFEARRLDEPITTANVVADVLDVPGVEGAMVELHSLERWRSLDEAPMAAILMTIDRSAIHLRSVLHEHAA